MSVLSACGSDSSAQPPASTKEHDTHPAPTPTTAPAKSARQRADDMDAMHGRGIKAFPAPTAGKGNQLLKPSMVGGVKVFELTAEVIDWEVEPGRMIKAWAYNGQVPGPQIRVREGDRVRGHY